MKYGELLHQKVYLEQPFQGIFIVGPLESVEHGRPHQQVREREDHKGQGLNLDIQDIDTKVWTWIFKILIPRFEPGYSRY